MKASDLPVVPGVNHVLLYDGKYILPDMDNDFVLLFRNMLNDSIGTVYFRANNLSRPDIKRRLRNLEWRSIRGTETGLGRKLLSFKYFQSEDKYAVHALPKETFDTLPSNVTVLRLVGDKYESIND